MLDHHDPQQACPTALAGCSAAGDFVTFATTFNASTFLLPGPASKQFVVLHLLLGWDAAVMWLSGIRATFDAQSRRECRGPPRRGPCATWTPHLPCGESPKNQPRSRTGRIAIRSRMLVADGSGHSDLAHSRAERCAQLRSWLAAVLVRHWCTC